MTEFIIINKNNEETCIFGYDSKDAFRRSNLNSHDWQIVMQTYVD